MEDGNDHALPHGLATGLRFLYFFRVKCTRHGCRHACSVNGLAKLRHVLRQTQAGTCSRRAIRSAKLVFQSQGALSSCGQLRGENCPQSREATSTRRRPLRQETHLRGNMGKNALPSPLCGERRPPCAQCIHAQHLHLCGRDALRQHASIVVCSTEKPKFSRKRACRT